MFNMMQIHKITSNNVISLQDPKKIFPPTERVLQHLSLDSCDIFLQTQLFGEQLMYANTVWQQRSQKLCLIFAHTLLEQV